MYGTVLLLSKYIINEIQSVTYIKLYTKIRIEIKHRIFLIQFKTIPSLYELVNNYKIPETHRAHYIRFLRLVYKESKPYVVYIDF
jgi:hypothetical protein